MILQQLRAIKIKELKMLHDLKTKPWHVSVSFYFGGLCKKLLIWFSR